MIVGFHFIICFFLIIFQTTVLATIPVNAYDLLAPFVVYLAVYQGPRKALPVILFIGLMMDGLSGGIFREAYNVVGGVDKVIPVDVYVPGCPAKPEAIIDGVVEGLAKLKDLHQNSQANALAG